jgi:type I restriction enzyme M protein
MEDYIKKAAEKPTEAASEFTVFQVGEDRYIFCPIRKRAYTVNDKPEEIVRQRWLYRLKEVYDYDFEQIDVEVKVRVGSTEAKKKADIVVYQDSKRVVPRIFVEVKKPNRKDGIDQLQVYMNATGCKIGLWSNGDPPHVYLLRIEPKPGEEEPRWRELRNVPAKNEKLADVDTPITRKELDPVHDFLAILKECEDYIKAHEGTSPFDEIFKLIFAKLFDEKTNLKNDDSSAQFRVGVFESPEEARVRIEQLFQRAKERWTGVFNEGEDLLLSDESLAFCISALQKAYLLKSDADVLGAAFEVMINPGMKGDKGQYFTPRHVIRMCIELLNPQDGETFFDPACGSGGFLVGAMSHVFAQIERDRDNENEIIENKKDFANQCIFGIDYDHVIAKIAKAYMLIWGDGRSNIAVCDALNEDNWKTEVQGKFKVGGGKKAILRQFDIIATNPPFAGDNTKEDTLSRYVLASKPSKTKGRVRLRKLSRDKLFIERCMQMLAPGGRLAIVLPRGVLKNYNDEYVRRFIIKHSRVVAVVGLGGDMFKPFTNTKTCVLFIQKRAEPIENKLLDHFMKDSQIAFAVTERAGKDKTGKLVLLDGHVDSDLPSITASLRKVVRFHKKVAGARPV